MKLLLSKIAFYMIAVYFLVAINSCDKIPLDPDNPDLTVSEMVKGYFSGDGKYMPANVSIGATYTCTTPNWATYLQSGFVTAIVTSINDNTINITLAGGIYANRFNKTFTVFKNGNEISDASGAIKYFINTEILQIAFSNTRIDTGNGCFALNEYYYVVGGAITSPPTPNIKYYSKERWEFTGTK